jgi:hypothetical protein
LSIPLPILPSQLTDDLVHVQCSSVECRQTLDHAGPNEQRQLRPAKDDPVEAMLLPQAPDELLHFIAGFIAEIPLEQLANVSFVQPESLALFRREHLHSNPRKH